MAEDLQKKTENEKDYVKPSLSNRIMGASFALLGLASGTSTARAIYDNITSPNNLDDKSFLPLVAFLGLSLTALALYTGYKMIAPSYDNSDKTSEKKI